MRVFGFRDEPCLMLKVITFTLKMTKEPRAETSDNLNIRWGSSRKPKLHIKIPAVKT
jgi:hypothetical protein